jgi:hypothetical protein
MDQSRGRTLRGDEIPLIVKALQKTDHANNGSLE